MTNIPPEEETIEEPQLIEDTPDTEEDLGETADDSEDLLVEEPPITN